jgi:DNA-directed RNA polymerase specialized sigma subunit
LTPRKDDVAAGHYVDARKFTALFRHRHKHREQISVAIAKIAAGVARRFWFRSANERDDAVQSATEFAIQKIEHFTYADGADAFAYYSTLTRNAVTRYLVREQRVHGRLTLFTDIDAGAARRGARLGLSAEMVREDQRYTKAGK